MRLRRKAIVWLRQLWFAMDRIGGGTCLGEGDGEAIEWLLVSGSGCWYWDGLEEWIIGMRWNEEVLEGRCRLWLLWLWFSAVLELRPRYAYGDVTGVSLRGRYPGLSDLW